MYVYLCTFRSMSAEILNIGGFWKHEKDARQNSTEYTLCNSSPSLLWSCFGAETMIGKVSTNIKNQDSGACRRFLCMQKLLVHAQESRTCTRFLFMHKILVDAHKSCAFAQYSCAFTRLLCMHKDPVHAQESCAFTRIVDLKTHPCC